MPTLIDRWVIPERWLRHVLPRSAFVNVVVENEKINPSTKIGPQNCPILTSRITRHQNRGCLMKSLEPWAHEGLPPIWSHSVADLIDRKIPMATSLTNHLVASHPENQAPVDIGLTAVWTVMEVGQAVTVATLTDRPNPSYHKCPNKVEVWLMICCDWKDNWRWLHQKTTEMIRQFGLDLAVLVLAEHLGATAGPLPERRRPVVVPVTHPVREQMLPRL
jgi:hypothetical protein